MKKQTTDAYAHMAVEQLVAQDVWWICDDPLTDRNAFETIVPTSHADEFPHRNQKLLSLIHIAAINFILEI